MSLKLSNTSLPLAFFFSSAEDQIQGLVYAKQEIYHRTTTLALRVVFCFVCSIFFQKIWSKKSGRNALTFCSSLETRTSDWWSSHWDMGLSHITQFWGYRSKAGTAMSQSIPRPLPSTQHAKLRSLDHWSVPSKETVGLHPPSCSLASWPEVSVFAPLYAFTNHATNNHRNGSWREQLSVMNWLT